MLANDSSIAIVGDYCPIGLDLAEAGRGPLVFEQVRLIVGENVKVIGNLETPITTANSPVPNKWATFRVDPRAVSLLNGMDVAVIANNHITDHGLLGANETIRVLKNSGIQSVGYGKSIDEAIRPAIFTAAGQRIGVVALSCPTTNGENLATHLSEGVAPLGLDVLETAVRRAREECDAVITYFHWGREFVHSPVVEQLRLGRYAIDCGADAVVGCHSHTIQPYELYRGRWIFYGLGNLFFGEGVGREVRPDLSVVHHRLPDGPANRESLIVVFGVEVAKRGVKLDLRRVQAVRQQNVVGVKAIPTQELSLSLDALNASLGQYVRRNRYELESRREVGFISAFRHGILTHHYPGPHLRLGADRDVDGGAAEGVTRIMRQMIPRRYRPGIKAHYSRVMRHVTAGYHESMIRAKWIRDNRTLPLTRDHWELYRIVHQSFWGRLRRYPRLIGCDDYNDRIQWLKLFDQDVDIVRCSSKSGLRDYATERGCAGYLPAVFQICQASREIRFADLPERFVIKATHDCGSVILVRDKAALKTREVFHQLDKALGTTYGWDNGEWPYAFIEPQIIVEEYLGEPGDSPPPDYKFHMVDGQMRWLQFISDRGRGAKEAIVDTSGKPTPLHLYEGMEHSEVFEKPDEWNELLKVASTLSRGWKYVRIDLYAINGRVVIGEMTFYPYFGTYRGTGQKALGQLLDFDRNTFKPPVYQRLRRSVVSAADDEGSGAVRS